MAHAQMLCDCGILTAQDNMLDLGIVAGFRLAIIQKETNHFNYSPDNNSHS